MEETFRYFQKFDTFNYKACIVHSDDKLISIEMNFLYEGKSKSTMKLLMEFL